MQGQAKKKPSAAAAAASQPSTSQAEEKLEIAATSTADALLTIDEFMQAAWGDQAADRLVA